MNQARPSAPNRLPWLAACLVALALVFFLVDRTASTWSHAHLHRHVVFDQLTHIVDGVRPGAAVLLIAVGIAACAGWRPGSVGMTVIAVCLSVLVAFEIKEFLKLAFGRTWPETWVANNPSWIKNGAFGFYPFHGKEGWSSFPSGHMTQMSALATALYCRTRWLGWVAVALAVLVAVGLYGADYHWTSDILAGAFLGFGTARGVLALLFRKPDPERPARP